MKALPGWIKRELRPSAEERTNVFQPIDADLLSWSIRHTETDSLRLRSAIRQLQDLPEAEPWSRKPDDLVHGGEESNFPNAPPGDETEPNRANDPSEQDSPVDDEETNHEVIDDPTQSNALTDMLPELDGENGPTDAPILSSNADDVPQPEPEEGLEGGDLVILSDAARALLDAETERSDILDDTLEELIENEFEPLPPDPTKNEKGSHRSHKFGRLPPSAYDEPVPTPRWLLMLLLLFLGLVGGRTEQGQRALGNLNRQELAWSLNGQVGSGQGISLGPGIIINGPAQVSRVSVGTYDSTVQLGAGQIDAQVDAGAERVLIVQAGPTIVSAEDGRVEIVRDGQRVEIWVEDGQVRIQTATDQYRLTEGERMILDGELVYGSSSPPTGGTYNAVRRGNGDSTSPSNLRGNSANGTGNGGETGLENGNGTNPMGFRSGPPSSPSSEARGANNPTTTPGTSTNTPSNESGSSGTNSGNNNDGENTLAAPILPEVAASPFDDVLQALDAIDSQVCNDDFVVE